MDLLPIAPPALHVFYVSTRNGVLLRATARDARHAARLVTEQAIYGVVMHVETDTEYRQRNAAAARVYCKRCGEPKAICGNWCVVDQLD